MDALVLAAMEKWPNVPDVYGWLRLDARAGWWLRQSRLTQPAICAFFDRNYACDAQGRYYVQNGPQRVFVALDRTPFIARREADGWRLVPTGARRRARAAWLTPEGEVMLDAEGVPALVDDSGECWYDSPIIAALLETLPQTPKLLPDDARQAVKVRQLEALADGVCDAALFIVREQMRPTQQQSPEEMLRQRHKITRALDALEQEAASGAWLNGDPLNLADIATGCAIGYINFRHVAPNWCVNRPALVKLVEKLFQRESFARTEPPKA